MKQKKFVSKIFFDDTLIENVHREYSLKRTLSGNSNKDFN
jgi:hypothetical protein